MRSRVDEAGRGTIRHRIREHVDPTSPAVQDAAASKKRRTPALPSDVANQIIHEMKVKHYAAWLDQAIPALDGLTPREAMKRATSRRQLDLLLKDIEHGEGRQPEALRFDVASLRAELGLES